MQKIIIEQLQVPTLIGVYDWERTQATNLLLTLSLDVDISNATISDNVNDTVDYGKVAEHVKQVASETSFELLEALGRRICESVLAVFTVDKITLKIEKPDILPDATTVSVIMAFDKRGITSI
ncbi:dihydroneopterin aldolase [Alteromonas sp. 5E99-2]|uniref:dihydroneopterin aldolase n=1 Tax=Alteromonas sp. 5E99-2 TaxID=2817683 RepID=UPI001A998C8E|nr:dihydroneopterin aldolase [Alteromonas sp. 5E99-2]MBO1254456.1 dihydroneopterin aldolase [Alteromonas sp. 5E99-2]